MCHDNTVMTIFTASNYCGSDYDGCSLVLHHGFKCSDVTNRRSPALHFHNIRKGVADFDLMPRKALQMAREGDYTELVKSCLAAESIMHHHNELFDLFSEIDPKATGKVRGASAVLALQHSSQVSQCWDGSP